MKLLRGTIFMFIVISFLVFAGCQSNGRSKRIYLYSKDKSEVITVLSDYQKNERVIALGKIFNAPEKNYVKLDISEVTELGDEIGICWFGKNKGWQFVSDKSKIIETRLDSTKYIVKTAWDEDKDGIPTPLYYRQDNCYTLDMLSHSKIYPDGNGYIERD